MKNDEGLDFARSRTTGRMVDITMVARGLACDCVCPDCGATLQARKGRKYRHYFAHHAGGTNVGTCTGGRESSLHAAARQVIADWNFIELPALLVEEGGRQGAVPGRIMPILRSELPDDHGGRSYWGKGMVRPDVVLHGDSEQIWCEVLATHTVDDQKEARLKARNISTLEFDLSEMHRHGGWNLATLSHALKTDSRIRRWVFHSGEESLRQRLRAENRAADALRRFAFASRDASTSSILDGPEPAVEEDSDLNLFDDGELVFHPSFGLIPKNSDKRRIFIERSYAEPKTYRYPDAVAYLRRHPHGQDSCLVTFGSSGPLTRVSEYGAALSDFTRSKGLNSVYFGIADFRQVRGKDSYALLDRFLTSLEVQDSPLEDRPQGALANRDATPC
ncbi:hypothetical protein AZOA_39590 [Azoarcus sp. Aa7]|nr:hypothetical protein [Azoarcus sp. Aa7]